METSAEGIASMLSGIGHSRRRLLRLMVASPAAALPFPALAQGADDFPSRPITLVVPYTPGALNDTLSRALAQGLTARFGRPVTVVNRPGAAAQVGTLSVARAAPDGYTLLMGSNAPLAETPALGGRTAYAVPQDFTFVARVSADNPWVMVTSTRLPVRTLAELVAYARAHPGAVRYGSIGIGSGGHLAMSQLEEAAGVEFTHVPYSGAAPVVTDLLAGNIDLGLTGIGTMIPHVNSDRVRSLAVTLPARNPHFPQVPTTAEAGFPSVVAEVWFGVVGPAGIPPAITERLSREIRAALEEEGVRRILTASGLDAAWLGPDDFARYARDYIEAIRVFSRTAAGRRMTADMAR